MKLIKRFREFLFNRNSERTKPVGLFLYYGEYFAKCSYAKYVSHTGEYPKYKNCYQSFSQDKQGKWVEDGCFICTDRNLEDIVEV